VVAFAEPFQARVNALMDDPAELDRTMAAGAARARELAAATLADVYADLGLVVPA
jgi:tryptophanyl-tRNA synthetase